jgi:hypothetical protein
VQKHAIDARTQNGNDEMRKRGNHVLLAALLSTVVRDGERHRRRLQADSQMRDASDTMPLIVKQIAARRQSGTGEKGTPFAVNDVETTNVMCLLPRRRRALFVSSEQLILDWEIWAGFAN